MSAASLSLLKGGAKGAADDDAKPKKGASKPANTAAAPQESEDEGTAIEVDNLSSEELDSVVSEFGVETPPEWATWGAEDKRAWLKSQFDDTAAGDQEAEAAPAQEPAPEEKKGKKPGKAKTDGAGDASADGKQKTKKPSKAVAKSAAKSGEIQAPGEDLLFDLVHEIETMKEPDARGLVGALAEQTEVTFFKLGGVLSVIQANGWYAPYPSFRDYVEKEHGLHYRKATYWVSIYNALVEAKVPWDKVKALGWTKLKEIAPVLTADNVDEWVKVAEQSNTLSLIDTVKKSQASKGGVKAIEDQSKAVTTMTFKVHEDQKGAIEAAIEKAKQDSGTTVATVALEYICGDFLAAQTLPQKMKAMGIEKALQAVEAAFPDAKIEVTLGEDE